MSALEGTERQIAYYKMITSFYTFEINEEIKKHIIRGYEPYGELKITYLNNNTIHYTQIMIKYK